MYEKGWRGGGKSRCGPQVSDVDVFGRRIGYCLELRSKTVKVGIEVSMDLVQGILVLLAQVMRCPSMHTEGKGQRQKFIEGPGV